MHDRPTFVGETRIIGVGCNGAVHNGLRTEAVAGFTRTEPFKKAKDQPVRTRQGRTIQDKKMRAPGTNNDVLSLVATAKSVNQALVSVGVHFGKCVLSVLSKPRWADTHRSPNCTTIPNDTINREC
jgi:hypothetical protein